MKRVVLLSGGMDSATLLYQEAQNVEGLYALGVNYGQRHMRELVAAQHVANSVGVPFTVVPLMGLRSILSASALTSDIPVPEGHYAAESMKATVVPMRNAIFLSVATGYAWSQGAEVVLTAVHAGDHAVYPDCRPPFIDAFNLMAQVACEGFMNPKILAPFVNMTKTEIAALGSALEVPWELTWSCYKGGEVHCGVCGTCFERREALAAFNDPTEYLT
jgi:7-cyano-7-deazaguanine synthase